MNKVEILKAATLRTKLQDIKVGTFFTFCNEVNVYIKVNSSGWISSNQDVYYVNIEDGLFFNAPGHREIIVLSPVGKVLYFEKE